MDMSAFTATHASEKVNEMDEELRKELEELKSELEENEVVHGIFPKESSSVPIPQSIDHFKRERKRIIARLLQVSECMPLKDQAQIMKEETSISEEREYTVNSLPLILHQYFLDRIQALVFAKHQHLLRWRRFCEHTDKIEALYPAYTKKLQKYLGEYQDAVQRAQRLAVAKTHLTGGKDPAFTAVKVDDMIIYLRWLICHLHSIKRFNYFMKVLKWLHINHKMDICIPRREDSDHEDSNAVSKAISLRYQDDPAYSQSKGQIGGSRPASASAGAKSATPVPAPPPLNLAILTTQVLPNSAMVYAAAAAGGGLASDENHLGLPLNDVDFSSLKPHLQYLINIYGIVFDLGRVQTSADEMEMFAAINRRFRHFFVKQEHLRTFHTYDLQQEGMEAEKSTHTFKQISNWLPFVELQPEEDANQLKKWTQLRQANKVDELLRVKAHFLRVSDMDKVQEALREHAAAVQKPPEIKAHSVTSHRTPHKTMKVWKRIYADPELYTERGEENDLDMFNMDEKECEQVNFKADKRNKKKKEGYDYQSTIQMLGLDDGEQDSNDPVTVQGAYLSFITLRHLRLRDLQRSCLSVLNYFRSIERTLTIYDGGLSLEDKNAHRTSNQDHREGTEAMGTQGGGGGLGCHAYLHNAPADYKISECHFMEFAEIENHDDFYTLEEGRVHVVDQRGYHIMYDSAIQDLENLEKDLLLVGTYYIEKDRDMRRLSKINPSKKRSQEQTAGDFDMASYAHQEVDRFGVLLDIWSNECSFLECKRELVDCYFEVYQNVFDRDERRKLAQVLTNLIYQRPRFDFNAEYFIHTYRTECIILRHHASLVKGLMDRQIDDEREYNMKVCRMGDSDYGLPDKIVTKQPIAINLSRPALKNVYMLEFHPSLAQASRIPAALKYAQREVINSNKPDSVTEALMIEKKMMELAIKDWEQLPDLGMAFAANVRRDLYGENFVEDPVFMVEVAKTMIEKVEKEASRKSAKERQRDVMGVMCDLLEGITLRYRIMEAANESEVLSRIYRNQAAMMGYEEHHLFMRCVQFEFASYKEDAGKPPPIFITSVHEDDASIDRYIPPHLWLAIHEVDEGHVGKFTFQHREGVLQASRPAGVESLQVILKAQVVHKNALVGAVEMVDTCHQLREVDLGKSGRVSPIETKSEKSTLTQMTGNSTATQGTAYAGRASKDPGRRAPESFVSLQLEKGPSRQLMLNEYWQKKQTMGAALKNMEEAERLKRGLISTFCDRVCNRVSQYALRAQIISYYTNIMHLLDDFPTIRNTYFMIGEPNEKKTKYDSPIGLEPDPRTFKKRPRLVISEDGNHVLNLWFIPHYMEVLIMFKFMDDTACGRALSFLLSIVSSLHDMLQYACAHARLGSSQARLGSQRLEGVSADWGGMEGIAAELRDIQTQVNSLPDHTCPEIVAEFLALRRDVMFLELDTAVRHSMADTFLATGNTHAYNAVNHSRFHALPAMSNIQRPDVCSYNLTVPDPFEARDLEARMYFPWRAFLGRNGPFTVNFNQWYLIDYNVQYCLAGLRDVDRHVANGEILGVTLLMEDVLQTGQEEQGQESEDETASQANSAKAKSQGETVTEADTSSPTATVAAPVKSSLSRSKQPVQAFSLLRNFLLLWKCLELVKLDWGRRKLRVEKINTPSLYRDFCKTYRAEILLPTLQSVGRRLGQGDLYEGLVLDTDVLVMPKGASEVEVRGKQLYRLLEALEIHMITDLRKKISRELNLAISERAREEGTLPTDLWKKSVMKESFTVPKAHVAENFAAALMSVVTEKEGEELEQYTFSREHMQKCMLQLSHDCTAREKACFESYAMYYENILKTQHHILYQREQELKRAQDELKIFHQNVAVEVQCELANCAHDLLMEITALRAKIVEMREMMMSQERDLRERVKDDYDDLIQNIFSSTFMLRSKFDKYRVDLVEDVYDKINETRREAVEAMARLKAKHAPVGEEDSLMGVKSQAEQIRELQHENLSLYKLIVELRTMNSWRHSHSTNHFMRLLADVRKRLERSQKECTEIQMLAEEEVILLRQQLLSVKKSLATAELECNEVRQKLEKELRIKMEKAHELTQKERSKKQLEAAKQANYEKLLDELDDKDTQLMMMQDEKEKRVHIEHMSQDKVKRDITDLKKQLTRERNLKLDAFQRVDDLQAQVYDYESVIMSTAHSAIAFSNSATPRSRSRATSAQVSRRSQPTSRGTTNVSTAYWPPHVVWPAYRSLTPMPEGSNGAMAEIKRVQRPKTVGGRLRSRLAEQLLNEIESDPQQQLVQFEQTQPL